jgi:hypothetical protein
VVYRLLTGYYVRSAFAEWRHISQRVQEQSDKLDAQSEVLYLLLRRLRTLERSLEDLTPSAPQSATENIEAGRHVAGAPALTNDPNGLTDAIQDAPKAAIAPEVGVPQGTTTGERGRR